MDKKSLARKLDGWIKELPQEDRKFLLAHLSGLKSFYPYWMNFQQLKMGIADAFVLIGVWVDKIIYWILTNKEAKKHPLRSHQHRGGIEYQIGITDRNFKEFQKFSVEPNHLVDFIKNGRK